MLNMDLLQELFDRAFDPLWMAGANLTMFGVVLFICLWTNNAQYAMASVGFFIAGGCIGALALTDRWMYSNKYEEEQPINTNGVINNAMQKTKYSVSASIE